tara:strand:- start:210 stop:689 length:480 start_codon:yes stop_codon:yes gene_type:complete
MLTNFLFTCILSYILFSISKEDIKTMLISECKLIIFAICGISYLICLSVSNMKLNIIDLIIYNFSSTLVVFIILLSIGYISYKLLGINSLGMGDIKLSSISSIWLGIELVFISLLISFSLSAIYSIYGKIHKKFKPFHQYPFAPFLSIGIFSSWILDKI